MNAAVYYEYGAPSVVSIKDIPVPEPGPNEVRVRVHAAAVTVADSRIRAARFPKGFGFLAKLAFGFPNPKRPVLGSCYSGVVDAVGSNVTDFAQGDEVSGMTGMRMGAHAEYVVVNAQKSIVHKPASVSHQDAAGVLFGGTAALYFLRDVGDVKKDEHILINGASGAVGTSAVQLACMFGAHVTAVTSGDHAADVTKLGATDVIDYTKTSWNASDTRYDVILDAAGTIAPHECSAKLTTHGRTLLMVPSVGQMITSSFYKQVKTGTATEKKEDIALLLQAVADKNLSVVIDSVYPLKDVVQAHERVDSKSKSGVVLLEMTN